MTTTQLSTDRIAYILRLYPEYNSIINRELSLTSDLAHKMLSDVKQYYELNKWEVAETVLSAVITWLKKDFHYLKSQTPLNMYRIDLQECMHILNMLIEECEKYKQWNTVHVLEREYAKLNVYLQGFYSTTTPIDENLSIR
jgi:hypothetical protein